jgi:hypothetical protein
MATNIKKIAALSPERIIKIKFKNKTEKKI